MSTALQQRSNALAVQHAVDVGDALQAACSAISNYVWSTDDYSSSEAREMRELQQSIFEKRDIAMRQLARFYTLDRANVAQVYSGKPGCMCGCNGNHRYASKYAQQRSDDVSDRSVSIVCGKIEKLLATPELCDELHITHDYVCVEANGRVYAAYFAEHTVARKPKAAC